MKKSILISTGHGLREDGTMDNGAFDAWTGTKEFDLNAEVASYCVDALVRQNVFTVKTDNGILGSAKNPSWKTVYKYLKINRFDLMLEIHHDSPQAKNAGFGIMPKVPYYKAQSLCENIDRAFIHRGLLTKASYRDVRGLGLLKGLTSPVLIWECANTTFVTDSTLKARGQAIAEGITKWFGVEFALDQNISPLPEYLKRGDKGNIVSILQNNLNVDTSLGGRGYFGPKTEAAVINWQKSYGIYPSGILTREQLRKLGLK